MLSLLRNKKSFRIKNKEAWKYSWLYWYKKEYVHQGIKEYLQNEFLQVNQDRHNLKVLDLGCGSAWIAKYFASYFAEYIGVDFNELLVKKLSSDFMHRKNCRFLYYDIESDENIPFADKKYDLILGNFILLELSELRRFFQKAASLQTKDNYLILTGLDPINEIYRVSDSLEQINKNIYTYRHANAPVVLSKKMSFNGEDTSFKYYRILYSINDIISVALESGYEISEVNDMLNKSADSVKAPLYYSLKLKRK